MPTAWQATCSLVVSTNVLDTIMEVRALRISYTIGFNQWSSYWDDVQMLWKGHQCLCLWKIFTGVSYMLQSESGWGSYDCFTQAVQCRMFHQDFWSPKAWTDEDQVKRSTNVIEGEISASSFKLTLLFWNIPLDRPGKSDKKSGPE